MGETDCHRVFGVLGHRQTYYKETEQVSISKEERKGCEESQTQPKVIVVSC